jgi:hypothetical protein
MIGTDFVPSFPGSLKRCFHGGQDCSEYPLFSHDQPSSIVITKMIGKN